MFKKSKAQSILEYATLIAVVAGALLAMQIYLKRSTQGRLRGASDEIGAQFDAESATIISNRTHTGNTVEVTAIGETTSTLVGNEVFTKTGSENVAAW